MAKAGRPSKYSEELAQEICDRMVEGEDLATIAKDPNMPSRVTLWRWQAEKPDFEAGIARAREALAEHDAHMIGEIARTTTKATAEADRVRLAAYQWLASKRAPKRWGDKIGIDAKVEVQSGPSDNLMTFLAIVEKNSGNGKKDH